MGPERARAPQLAHTIRPGASTKQSGVWLVGPEKLVGFENSHVTPAIRANDIIIATNRSLVCARWPRRELRASVRVGGASVMCVRTRTQVRFRGVRILCICTLRSILSRGFRIS